MNHHKDHPEKMPRLETKPTVFSINGVIITLIIIELYVYDNLLHFAYMRDMVYLYISKTFAESSF